jgi:hypothetical protein
MKHCVWVFAVVLLVVAACVPPPNAGIPQAGTVDVNKGALSSVIQRLNFYYELHADCTSAGYPTVRIVSPPANGRLLIESAMDYPTYPQSNQRYQCNLRMAPGTAVSYLSNPGFRGGDTATTEALFPNGLLRQTHFNISVR